MLKLMRSRVSAGLVGIAALALTVATGSLASAATPSPTPSWQSVPSGPTGPALPDASAFGDTAADTPETVSFVLKMNRQSQLAGSVLSGSGGFLTTRQFTDTYAPSTQTVAAITAYLAKYGITSTVYGDRLDISASGTAGQFDKALNVTQRQYHVPARAGKDGKPGIPAQTVHAPTSGPSLPPQLAQYVTAIFGLTNYAVATASGAQQVDLKNAKVASAATSDSDCIAASGLPDDCNLPQDFASRYGLTSAYKKANGAGETVGIVTFAALDVGAPEYFWTNVAHIPATGRTVTVKDVQGGPGAPSDASGTGETDLDVEQAGGVAPGANVIVYQAPNTDSGTADAFAAVASDNVADSVSMSWAESETYVEAYAAQGMETSAFTQAFDEFYLELAAQGQSTFFASGDWAAYTANVDLGTTNLSVATFEDSPYVTSAGGTTLPWSATFTAGDDDTEVDVDVTAERAWAYDYLWPLYSAAWGVSLADAATSLVDGTGGGFSVLEPQPSYQKGVSGTSSYTAVPYFSSTEEKEVAPGLTLPTAFVFHQDPALTKGSGTGRATPDISADADPYTGYTLYEPSAAAAGGDALAYGWGGTSFVAPQLNGAAAVIDQLDHGRTGLWNPAVYRAAQGRQSPFTTLSTAGETNDNLYYTGTPGTVYNPATGLGTPNLTSLAAVVRR